MPDRFEFATAGRIIFGAGTLREVGALAAEMGRRALVVSFANASRTEPLLAVLRDSGIAYSLFAISGEPRIATAQAGAQQAVEAQCDLVIGFGGGAVLDGAKAIAALATNPGDPLDYLEVIGRAQPLKRAPLPCIAIPTTAGTGSEVTRNAVLTSEAHQVKVSLRHPLMLPRLALVDPELTYSVPPAITASTGLDALTQCMEPFVSNRANPMTDALCRDGMQRAARSLRRAYENGQDAAAREAMALTSLYGGLALANARLGAVHGFAAPIGGMFPAPHGAVCACLLPHVMAANIRALKERAPEHEALRRYDEIAQILTGDPRATAPDGTAWVSELVAALQIPGLRAYGIGPEHFASLAAKAAAASSMQGNPIKLTDAELIEILSRAL